MKLVGECGTDLRAWPSAKRFTSWLCLAPGKVLSSRTHGDRPVAQPHRCGWQQQPSGGAIRRSVHSIADCPHVRVSQRR
ncbi:hypothetical protein MTX26_27355 [Bradyrhizobium sp. ISRA443]|nr:MULTISPECIES: hypothetical protein [unclassified Bradyrhizobium]WGR96250.1 hypothetical protein MTX20_02185 [Bradyrhizobium sp. ISRA435]WGS02805.1 hypothetical protein MTX23_27350 [Bradyrhizobium sp. ISRA436]WGS09691.1 hypothetical protein MTX18_27360 [Bradyrhizobium sp. ISRA437]WGS16575.1 hypothetical protein MTX26_27355 [Bradyrhizobium sp. ISRA443]